MEQKILEIALENLLSSDVTQRPSDPVKIKKVRARPYSYTNRYRGQWFRPEYEFDEIQIAASTDSFVARSIKKKNDRFLLAGYELVSENPDSLTYIKRRIREMEIATQFPFQLLLAQTARDVTLLNNCMWVKTRDVLRSTGKIRKDIRGVELDPVAGYHILPFETVLLKTRPNGEIKKVMQMLPDGSKKEFAPSDVIHFYSNKNPGFSVGTPDLLPALDDVALLRRIEENVEELIETNLFPVYHYRVGNDQFPERFGPDGRKETDIIKEKIEYMPSGGVYVSDHRHEVMAIGSESKALRIDFYLTYFKSRVFAALGVSGVDMGEGDTANRSTAQTMSKSAMMDVEALQALLKIFIEFYVIDELLLEGGFNPLDEEQRVFIKFGIIDKAEQTVIENQQIQMFANKLVTQTEARKHIGLAPMKEQQQEDTYYKKYEEPLALIKSMAPGSAASETLSDIPTSNISPEAINKEKTFAKQVEKTKRAGQQGRPANSSSTGQKQASASKSRPSNQTGTRPGPKLSKDVNLTVRDKRTIIPVDIDISDEAIAAWKVFVVNRYNELAEYGVSLDTVVENMLPRLYLIHEETNG